MTGFRIGRSAAIRVLGSVSMSSILLISVFSSPLITQGLMNASAAEASASSSNSVTSDFNGDGRDDLAIGVPSEDIGSYLGAGAVNVIYGSSGGLRASASGSTPDDQFWHENVPGVQSSPLKGSGFGSVLAAGDFDDDGYADLAVGVPGKKPLGPSGSNAGGAVHVLYGSSSGLQTSSPAEQFWTQDTAGVKDAPDNGDLLGAALAVGDINGDGYTDLAIGAPGEDGNGGDFFIGAVHILFGSASGLQADSPDDQLLFAPPEICVESSQSGGEVGIQTDDTGPCDHRRFGEAVSVGDYNDDGYADVAVAQLHDVPDNQLVFVFPGSSSGLEESPVLEYPLFAPALSSGDFDNDGFDDLAAGSPEEEVSGLIIAGLVEILYGSQSGLQADSSKNQVWHEDSPGVRGSAEAEDRFGFSLATGDLNGDGYSDLAVGIPFQAVNAKATAGAVNVFYGSSTGLQADSPNDQRWNQDSTGVADTSEVGDLYGWAVSAGDFNGDGKGDLAIGARGEDISTSGGNMADAGAVNVLYGSSSGLRSSASGSTPEDQFWHQNSSSVKDSAEIGNRFGGALPLSDGFIF